MLYWLPGILLIIIDIMFIIHYMKNEYEIMISRISKKKLRVNKKYLFFCYILMLLGLYIFVLPNVIDFTSCFQYGFMFGFILYGVYDGVCASIFGEEWNKSLMVKDILWGSFLYSFISVIYLMI